MDTLDALRLFVKVADVGSFSAVARGRALAVSTVTLAVQQLEQQVSSPLLQRTTRKVSLTEEGQLFYQHAQTLLRQWQHTLEAVQPQQTLRGDIHIAAPSVFARQSLLPIIDGFMAMHPDIAVHLLLSDREVNLQPSRLDVAIMMGPLPDSGLRAKRLLTGRMLLCASPQYWHTHGKPLQPQDLTEHQCLYTAKPGAQNNVWTFQEGEHSHNIKVHSQRVANDNQILLEWTLQHHGISLQAPWDIAAALSNGQLSTALDAYHASAVDLYAVFPKSPSARCLAWVQYVAEALHSQP
ncbi:LysR substrate-binding domain-containing protein [Vitreoscilla massiliensis]|uniref:LysR substrate-binding domain-containing protein n=1 Tax=Vitreoscilla massiliensis TaxID=1689272 RepID=A0ABY4E557_9NEIS|nr:LysR family transcriptional regulator [Vitreoscilla massiliensis]UOO90895.1 LysR substrate-binding domain-containing protein [Vitreoscilla massiliensis]